MSSGTPLIIRERVPRSVVVNVAQAGFGDMAKAVVDIGRHVIALGGELHSDAEAALLADGSRQQDIWGINLYPDEDVESWIEFDSLINVRPLQGNRSRGVDDEFTRQAIQHVVDSLVSSM